MNRAMFCLLPISIFLRAFIGCLVVAGMLMMLSPWPVMAKSAGASGLPVPRFVSLKSDEVNMRAGPGTRYPIRWVYVRKDTPVEIIEEFGHWRKVRDVDGDNGWIHQTMLKGTRMAFVHSAKATIYAYPYMDANPLFYVEPQTLVEITECKPLWCNIRVNDLKGWISKENLWGVYKNEQIK